MIGHEAEDIRTESQVIHTTRIQQTEAIAAWLDDQRGKTIGWVVASELARRLREEPLK
jgi:predicted HAD superfamily phosphohydrolase YqeG